MCSYSTLICYFESDQGTKNRPHAIRLIRPIFPSVLCLWPDILHSCKANRQGLWTADPSLKPIFGVLPLYLNAGCLAILGLTHYCLS